MYRDQLNAESFSNNSREAILEEKIALLINENRSLNEKIFSLRREKESVSPFRGRDHRTIDLENKVQMLISENDRLNVMMNDYAQEADAWKSKYMSVEQDAYLLDEAQSKLTLLIQEIERLNSVLR